VSQQGNAAGGESERERDTGQKKENETQLKASQWLHSGVLVRLRSKKGERERSSPLVCYVCLTYQVSRLGPKGAPPTRSSEITNATQFRGENEVSHGYSLQDN